MLWYKMDDRLWDRRYDLGMKRSLAKTGKSSHTKPQMFRIYNAIGEGVFEDLTARRMNMDIKRLENDGIDFTVGHDTIDVVTTQHSPPMMRCAQSARRNAMFYVMVQLHVTSRHARCLGWLTRSQLEACPVRDFGYGPALCATRAEIPHNQTYLDRWLLRCEPHVIPYYGTEPRVVSDEPREITVTAEEYLRYMKHVESHFVLRGPD